MKKNIQFNAIWAVALLLLSLGACSSEDHYIPLPEGNHNGENKTYAFSYWALDYAQYLSTVHSLDDLMHGTINMKGVGIEQAGNMIPAGNRYFACSTGEDGGRAYYVNNKGELDTGGREFRIYVDTQYAYCTTHDNKAVIIGASWESTTTTNELLVYDPQSVSYTSRKVQDFGMMIGDDPYVQWPTSTETCGDYLFVSYYPKRYQVSGWDLVAQDQAMVKVFKYPSLEYVKDITDPRTSTFGMYYANTNFVRTSNGDIYGFSCNSYAGGFIPTENVPAGVLRIKSGETEFDTDYFLNTEESILGGKIVAAYPAGDTKAYVTYIENKDDTKENNFAFLYDQSKVFHGAIIDLPTQQITKVTGLDNYGGDNFYGYASLYAENGKAYKSFVTDEGAYMYQIDLNTGVATRGAKIEGGKFIPTITSFNY